MSPPGEKPCPSLSDLTYSDAGFGIDQAALMASQQHNGYFQQYRHPFDDHEDVGGAAAAAMQEKENQRLEIGDEVDKAEEQTELSQRRLQFMTILPPKDPNRKIKKTLARVKEEDEEKRIEKAKNSDRTLVASNVSPSPTNISHCSVDEQLSQETKAQDEKLHGKTHSEPDVSLTQQTKQQEEPLSSDRADPMVTPNLSREENEQRQQEKMEEEEKGGAHNGPQQPTELENNGKEAMKMQHSPEVNGKDNEIEQTQEKKEATYDFESRKAPYSNRSQSSRPFRLGKGATRQSRVVQSERKFSDADENKSKASLPPQSDIANKSLQGLKTGNDIKDEDDSIIHEMMKLKLELAQLKGRVDEQHMVTLRISEERCRLSLMNKKYEHDIKNLAETNTKLTIENKQYRHENSTIKEKWLRLTIDESSMKNENRVLKDENDKLKTEGEQMSKVILFMKDKMERLSTEKETLSRDHSTLTQERKEFVKETKEISSAMTQLQGKANDANMERETLLNKLKQVEAERDKLRIGSMEACNERDILRREVSKLSRENDCINGRLDRSFFARSTASSTSEAEGIGNMRKQPSFLQGANGLLTNCFPKPGGGEHWRSNSVNTAGTSRTSVGRTSVGRSYSEGAGVRGFGVGFRSRRFQNSWRNPAPATASKRNFLGDELEGSAAATNSVSGSKIGVDGRFASAHTATDDNKTHNIQENEDQPHDGPVLS